MTEGPGEAVLVDVRGLRCPLPVIRLAQAARDAPPGTVVLVLATDPAARSDIPAWCRMRGQTLESVVDKGVEGAEEGSGEGAVEDGAHTAYRVVLG